MKNLLLVCLLIFAVSANAQQRIDGRVTDLRGTPVPGANLYIDGSYDGTTSSDSGNFAFTTSETGAQTLVITCLSFETLRIPIDVNTYKTQTFKLRESINALDVVIINAGTFEAGDKARNAALKPLDIVTTAGSSGDIVAALMTLPGTQTVAEDGRLFVRGGEADETQTYIDGLRVAQPYGATAANIPTRGRFSPFLFSGISFSTGGYSAEYGQALSSVLLLSTQDEPDQEKTDIALMTVGLGVGNTQKWKKASLSVNVAYIDLTPYQWAIPQNVHWHKPYQSASGEAVFRQSTPNGLFKLYAAFDASRFDLDAETIRAPQPVRTAVKNNNLYLNAAHRETFGAGWSLNAGASFGYSGNAIGLNEETVDNSENAFHAKIKFGKRFSDHFKLHFGADLFHTDFAETFTDQDVFTTGYDQTISAGYITSDWYLSKRFAVQAGIRAEHDALLGESSVSPRGSVAYKVGKLSQFSFAYGDFQQSPNAVYLKLSDGQTFRNQRAAHYILNYQYARDRQLLRFELYEKTYRNLIKFSGEVPEFSTHLNQSGRGYARGVDVFWRDGRSFKNLEYWISYSYIDTRRNYKNYEAMVRPSFAAAQSLSVVTKYWIQDWRSQIGLTNSFTTGRPFDNPNEAGFMRGRTKGYNSLNASWAYLLSQQKILYFSVSNILGTDNVSGYEYAASPDASGVYQRRAIRQAADRFFFIGFFWTISEDKTSNQLDNL